MTQFDPPYQVGIQSNSGGDITIEGSSITIAGRDLNFGAAQDRQALISQLEQLRKAFTQVEVTQVIGEETAIDAEAAIKKAIGQSNKPLPDKKAVLGYLASARALIEGLSGVGGLVNSIAGAIDAVHRLFP